MSSSDEKEVYDHCPVCVERRLVNVWVTCAKCDFSCCQTCVKKYLLNLPDINAKCMNCSAQWDFDFVAESTHESFHNKTYRDYRAKLLMERERSLLPSTQPLADPKAPVRTEENVKADETAIENGKDAKAHVAAKPRLRFVNVLNEVQMGGPIETMVFKSTLPITKEDMKADETLERTVLRWLKASHRQSMKHRPAEFQDFSVEFVSFINNVKQESVAGVHEVDAFIVPAKCKVSADCEALRGKGLGLWHLKSPRENPKPPLLVQKWNDISRGRDFRRIVLLPSWVLDEHGRVITKWWHAATFLDAIFITDRTDAVYYGFTCTQT